MIYYMQMYSGITANKPMIRFWIELIVYMA